MASQPCSSPGGSWPKLCRAQVRHSNAFKPWKPHGHKTSTDTLPVWPKRNYCMYFLCKEKVPIANPSQQATDLFPHNPSETSNYQETAIKSRSSTQMVRDRAAERSNTLSLSCTSYSHILKTSPVRRIFSRALIYEEQQQYKITRLLLLTHE